MRCWFFLIWIGQNPAVIDNSRGCQHDSRANSPIFRWNLPERPDSTMSPSAIEVVPVSGKADQKAFVRFAWDHYRGDPNWIPPLRGNQQELLHYRPHPFYEDAEIQTFLARRGGKYVGRVAAIVDHAHNRTYNELRGMFGFFESVDDQGVADALFNAALNWFKERGIEKMRGPMNPSMNYECALLVDGFDSHPTFGMTYNKPYYGKLIEGFGFTKAQDLYAFWGDLDLLDSLDPKLLFVAEEARKRFHVSVRRADKKNFRRDVRSFMEIYNRALPGQWGFVPMSAAEVEHMAGGLQHLIVPEMTTIAEVNGSPVAVTFGLLDYNPLIKQIDGRLFPFGLFQLLWGRKRIRRIRLISTNVLPEYQRWGLGLVLMQRMVPDGLAWGITNAEFSWVLESNRLSRGTLERGGAKLTKTYRIYDFEPQ